MGSTFVVGDLHGNLFALKNAIEELDLLNKDNTIIFIGDYADYGKYNADTLYYVMKLCKKYDNVKCLIGDHDLMLLNQLENYLYTPNKEDIYYDKNYLYYSGGKNTFDTILKEYSIDKQVELTEWIKDLPYRIDVKVNGKIYCIVHSDIVEKLDKNSKNFEHKRRKAILDSTLKNICTNLNINDSLNKLDDILNEYDVDAIVFGHVTTNNISKQRNKMTIQKMFNNRLICIDCGSEYINSNNSLKYYGQLGIIKLDDLTEYYF